MGEIYETLRSETIAFIKMCHIMEDHWKDHQQEQFLSELAMPLCQRGLALLKEVEKFEKYHDQLSLLTDD